MGFIPTRQKPPNPPKHNGDVAQGAISLNAYDVAKGTILINDHGVTINSGPESYTKKLMELIDQRIAALGDAPLVEHKCHNCGATLLHDADKHIFACPYCHSTYVVGTKHLYDNGVYRKL